MRNWLSWFCKRFVVTVAVMTAVSVWAQVPKRVQMAYNYCTLSYTMPLWSEEEWGKEIERLAEAGFTHVLVNAGMEQVWYDFLTTKLTEAGLASNYTDAEARAHIPHPAWRAWWLMGNLEGEGRMLSLDGYALSKAEIERQAEIGRFIVEKCWERGMTPVLPAFVGLVPTDFKTKFPSLECRSQGEWCSYARPWQLVPTDSAFPALAKAYHETLFEVYGVYDRGGGRRRPLAFSGDLFHEGGDSSGLDVTAVATQVQTLQQEAYPGIVWILMHWQSNPTAALMAGCDEEHTLIQCLDRDMTRTKAPNANIGAYIGKNGRRIPWIWTEVTNFGDNPNLYGSLERMQLAKAYFEELKIDNPTECRGWGMLDEGISYSALYYKEMLNLLGTGPKSALPDSPDAKPAWDFLLNSVYRVPGVQEGCTEGILCAEPHRGITLGYASEWGTGGAYYDKRLVRRAAQFLRGRLLLKPELAEDAEWRTLYIDVMRQMLVDAFTAESSLRKPEVFALMDELLLRSDTMTLWQYWEQAKRLAPDDETAALRHYRNFLCLMTIWKQGDATNASALHDYSHRNLGGMMAAYYGRRWQQYWEGKDASTIRVADAEWWKTAPIPPQPIKPTAEDLLRLGADALAYDITANERPLDHYAFETADQGNLGTSGRTWDTASTAFDWEDVTVSGGHQGVVSGGNVWSTAAEASLVENGYTLSLVATLGGTENGPLFSTDNTPKQWGLRRTTTGTAEVKGLFAEDLAFTVGDDDAFHHYAITVDLLSRVGHMWLDGTEITPEAGQPLAEGLTTFTAYQLLRGFGGNTSIFGTTAGAGRVDDFRLYAFPFEAERVKALSKTLLAPIAWMAPDAGEHAWANASLWEGDAAPTSGKAGIRAQGETSVAMTPVDLETLILAGEGPLSLTGEGLKAKTLAVQTNATLAPGLATFGANAVSITAGKTLTVRDATTVPLSTAEAVTGSGTLRVENAAFTRTTISANEPTLCIGDGATLTFSGATGDQGKTPSIHKTVEVQGSGKMEVTAVNAFGWAVDATETFGAFARLSGAAVLNITKAQVVHNDIVLNDNATLNYTEASTLLSCNKGCLKVERGSPLVTGEAIGIHNDGVNEATLFDIAKGASLHCAAPINPKGETAKKRGAGHLIHSGGFSGGGTFVLGEGTMCLKGAADFGSVTITTVNGTTLDLGTVRSAKLGDTLGKVEVSPSAEECAAESLTLIAEGTLADLHVIGAQDVTQTHSGTTLTVSFTASTAKWEDGAWEGLPIGGDVAVASVTFSDDNAFAQVPEGAHIGSLTVEGEGTLSGAFTVQTLSLKAGAKVRLPSGALHSDAIVTVEEGTETPPTLTLALEGAGSAIAPAIPDPVHLVLESVTAAERGAEPATMVVRDTLEAASLTLQGAAPIALEGAPITLAGALSVNVESNLAAGVVQASEVTLADGITLTVNDATTVPLKVKGVTGANGTLRIRNAAFERDSIAADEPTLCIDNSAVLEMKRAANKDTTNTIVSKTVEVAGTGTVRLMTTNIGGWKEGQDKSFAMFSLRDEAVLECHAIEVLTHPIWLSDHATVKLAIEKGIMLKDGSLVVKGGSPSIVATTDTASISLEHVNTVSNSPGFFEIAEGATLRVDAPFQNTSGKKLSIKGTGTLEKSGTDNVTLECASTKAGVRVCGGSLSLILNQDSDALLGPCAVDSKATLSLSLKGKNPWNFPTSVKIDGALELNNITTTYAKISGNGLIRVTGESVGFGNAGDSPSGLSYFTGSLEVAQGSKVNFCNWNSSPYRVTLASLKVEAGAEIYQSQNNKVELTTKALSGGGNTKVNTFTFASGATLDATVGNPSLNVSPVITDTVAVTGAYGIALKAPGLDAAKFAVAEPTDALPLTNAEGLALVQRPADIADDAQARHVATFVFEQGITSGYTVADPERVGNVLACFEGSPLALNDTTVSADCLFGISRVTLRSDAGGTLYMLLGVTARTSTGEALTVPHLKVLLDGKEVQDIAQFEDEPSDTPGETLWRVPYAPYAESLGTLKVTVKAVDTAE